MKRNIFLVVALFGMFTSWSQEKGDILLGTQADLIKSDYDILFNKVQIGLEGNYFVNRRYSFSGGLEIWSNEGLSAAVGGRWYPTQDTYIRFRGLAGANVFSIGGGFAKPLGEVVRFEAMTDFYFNGTFTIRAGVAYMLQKEKGLRKGSL